MAQRGDLGNRSHGGQGATFACGERTETGLGRENMGKPPPPPKAAGKKVENWKTATGIKLKREKGERRGFKFH